MSGHHGVYLRWIAQAAVERGLKVSVATRIEAMEHSVMEDIQNDIGDRCNIIGLPGQSSEGLKRKILPPLLETQLINYSFWADAYRNTPDVDFVFVCHLDACLYYLSVFGAPFGKTKWGGIVTSIRFHLAEMEDIKGPPSTFALRLKGRLFMQLLQIKTLGRIVTINEALPVYVRSKDKALAEKLCYLADPNEIAAPMSRAQGCGALGLDAEKWIVLLFGSLSLRKGTGDLLDAVVSEHWPSGAQVVLAGRQDKDVRKILERDDLRRAVEDGHVHVIDRFISDEERDAALAACDVVWCSYRNFYVMSGVLVLAGLAQRPVIASGEGLIGWLTQKYDSGIVLGEKSPSAVCTGVRDLKDHPERSEAMGHNGGKAYQEHGIEKAKITIGDLLARESAALRIA